MENFKQIAEYCLAGKLSGTFINRRGDIISSDKLHKFDSIKYPYIYGEDCITRNGNFFYNEEKISGYDIIDFIPDMKKEQITIDVPEGMEAVQEIVDGEIRIKFVDKKLTYGHVVSELLKADSDVVYEFWSDKISEGASKPFYKKVEVLRKLTNIRNYFGKPECDGMGYYIDSPYNAFKPYIDRAVAVSSEVIVFATKEHAEQAIKMLGDELKYLFEPW